MPGAGRIVERQSESGQGRPRGVLPCELFGEAPVFLRPGRALRSEQAELAPLAFPHGPG